MKKSALLLMLTNNTLLQRILSWQAGSTTTYNICGKPEAYWSHITYTGGSTQLMPYYAVRYKGTLTQIKLKAHAVTGAWKLKLFRYNSNTSVYDFVSESSFTPTGGDEVSTHMLTTPLACDIGDIPALYIPADNSVWACVTTYSIPKRTATGDITTSNAFSTTTGGYPNVDISGITRPYVAICGNSITEGTNTASFYNSLLRQNPAVAISPGVLSLPGGSELANWGIGVSDGYYNGSTLSIINVALTNATFATLLATQVPLALSYSPYMLVLACGTNDVIGGRTWEQIESDLNAIKILIDATSVSKVVICGILPRTGITDEQSANIRTTNTNLQSFCSTNSYTFIDMYESMGQIRVSTGFYDDLKTEYSLDGTHLSADGVTAYKNIVRLKIP